MQICKMVRKLHAAKISFIIIYVGLAQRLCKKKEFSKFQLKLENCAILFEETSINLINYTLWEINR